jgi:hypothetical protein
MIVKKASGSFMDPKTGKEMTLAEVKKSLNDPQVLTDPESLIQNGQKACADMYAGLQHRMRAKGYQTDLADAKTLHLLMEISFKIEARQRLMDANDAFAQLPEEELEAKLKALYAAKVGNK